MHQLVFPAEGVAMSKCTLGTLVLSLVLPSIAVAQSAQPATLDTFRLAHVSPQRAFYESNDGKAAAAKLNSLQPSSRKPRGKWMRATPS